jgi:hypothetical protein
VVWVILAIAAAGVAAISFEVVPPLVGIGLVLAGVIVAVAVVDPRGRPRRSQRDPARALEASLDDARLAERQWNPPRVGGGPGDGGMSGLGG